MESLLDDGHMQLQKTVRQFAIERVAPVIGEYYRESRFPADLVTEMGDLGLFGGSVADEGLGIRDSGLESGRPGMQVARSPRSAIALYDVGRLQKGKSGFDLAKQALPVASPAMAMAEAKKEDASGGMGGLRTVSATKEEERDGGGRRASGYRRG